MEEFTRLRVRDEGPVCHIAFDRENSANAMDGQSWDELRLAMRRLDRMPELRAAILHGIGPHFCAGIDRDLLTELRPGEEFPGRSADAMRRGIIDIQGCVTAIEETRKPVVAAIHGACIGGGLEIAAACDIRIGSRDARFCLKEVDLGIVADVGALQRLPGLIGQGRARELALTARTIDIDEAFRIGLVTGVYADRTALLAAAVELAAGIAAKSPLAVQGTKEVMVRATLPATRDSLAYQAAVNTGILFSPDLTEAMTAAQEKRTPKFDD